MTIISEAAMLSELSAEFPGYEFSTQRTWEGVSLIAVRQAGSDRAGPYVVITPHLDEMRSALLESKPGGKARQLARRPSAIDDHVVVRCRALRRLGARHLSFGPPLGPDPVAAIRLLGEAVLPALNSEEG